MAGLFDRLCEVSTLKTAFQKVLQKNSQGGLDGVNPSDLGMDVEKVISGLADDLRRQKYVPVPYAKRTMPKFNERNEWRKLSLPAVIDKVVQQAFRDVVGPIFERDFLDCSYAYRKGKGPVKAIKRVEHILSSRQIQWVATLDIDDFFDSMDHDLLVTAIAQKVNEPQILNLVDMWLHAGIISPRGDWDEPSEGIAQGSVVSPLFSNIYLHRLDEFVVENRCPYVRYSDNFIILSSNKDNIYVVYEQIQSFLEDPLKLKLNNNPYPFKAVNKGFAFLGIYFRDDLRRISSAKETRIFRKLNWLTERSYQKDPESFLRRSNESVEGIKRYYSFIGPVRQFEAFDQHLLKRLRSLLIGFVKKGLFRTKNELLTYISKISFFNTRPDDSQKAISKGLTDEIFRAVNGEKGSGSGNLKNQESSQSKRQTSQKTRYLKKVADQAEIIVSRPGVFIGKTGRRIIMREQRKNIAEIPFSKIRNVAINSNGISLSSDVIFQCSRSKIPITFYTFKGMPYAVLQNPLYSMGTVSVLQIKAYETEKALELVKKILTGKARNQMNLLKFYLRSRKESQPAFADNVADSLEKIEAILDDLQKIKANGTYSVARDRLFSTEGRISSLYWNCMKMLINPELSFKKRERFKASDLVNNMLNYGYGILYQRVWQAIVKTGLNPHISFLHAFQAGKPTLVYDLVEEFRQPFVDRAIFSLLTRGKKGRDLKIDHKTGLLNKITRDQVVKAVLSRLASLIGFRGKKVRAEDIIETQTQKVVAYLEGRSAYRPFIAGY